ncbi:hypothetical protein V499_08087 [Pseudogymnoascus sp. VKM F-103]|uniref:Myb-like domain-containing protein n=1 Tax=Pseudogymnoascus verrucosus TaxID=342668 RepID=A0A1B8G9X8_9PEZI|nr:uncharacterized protein VE01_09837 [Pseudogymnoascus verrucosus]KFY71734.1 hypothetical protein V499_08087 [Pseudogymnoascus sp. VKM F-103]OBT92646.1 hypothetical protein VE01_09837 [Pseudogymnoascus verrucosus]
MSRTLEAGAAQPRISFTNWILGGPLVTVPPRQRKPGERLPSGDANKELNPKCNFIDNSKLNEKRYYQNRRVSKDKVTDTKKDAEKGNKEKERRAEALKKAVPKDEIAKKEEQNKQAQQSSGWTKAQDDKILAMKKAGNSWKMIAQEVGASKKDVTIRFKELSKAGEKSGYNDDPFPFGDMPGMFKEDEPTEDSKSPAKLQKKGKGEKGGGKADNGGKGEKGEKDKIVVDKAALEAENGKKVLVPDSIWTIGDLEVLANVEERYRELKWMHVQAGFYNMTGRMVGSEVIKAKFEQG